MVGDILFSFSKMVEEFQKYKDILKQEREVFKKQLEREVSISGLLLIRSK